MTINFIQIGSVIGLIIGLAIWIKIYKYFPSLKYYTWMVFSYLIHVLIFYVLFTFQHGLLSGSGWTNWSSIIRFQTVFLIVIVGISILQILKANGKDET